MTELAIPTNGAELVGFGSPSDALDRLARWVDAASNATRLVSPLVGSAFVPDAYKPKVDPRATHEQKADAYQVAVANATAAVLQGLSLGLDPLVSLQQIYVVHGRPGMYTKIKVALVQAHGHEVWTEDLTDTRAVVCGRRKGTDVAERVTVTMDQARKAGWTSNQAYTKTPQDMLWARAAARVCDRIASDVLMGIASIEEIQDELAPAGTGTRTVRPPARRLGEQRPALPAAVEPPLDEEPAVVVDDPPAEPEPGITQAQQRKLHALLKENDLADREMGLLYITGVIDREITTTKDLSKREAMLVIDQLDANAPQAEPPLEDQPAGDHLT